jgi:hypothetical protein
MKKLLATCLTTALFVFAAGAAGAGQSKIEMFSSTIILEASASWGYALVDIQHGVVQVVAKDLPTNSAKGVVFPVTLTDSSVQPADARPATSYQAWLLRVQQVDGEYWITDGIRLGDLRVRPDGTGRVRFKTREDLKSESFNFVAVTAEDDAPATATGLEPGTHDWIAESMGQAMTWRGQNSVIVLWGEIAPIP